MQLKTLYDADIKTGTRVFVRVDLDVPVENGAILETFRLERALPTLKYIIEKGGTPIIAGHTDCTIETLNTFFEKYLSNYELLPNLRADPREKENSESFAKELIQKTNVEIYINESFATSHREHASIVQLPRLLHAYAGLNLQREIEVLEKVLNMPDRPCIAIVGGAKAESKLPTITNLSKKADEVLIAGNLGIELQSVEAANISLPVDYIDNKDIGEKTLELYIQKLSTAKTVIWAGPVGMWEDDRYLVGTEKIAQTIIDAQAYSVVGGGDTIAALHKCNKLDKISFVSTGGSAMLQFLAKETLPGLMPLIKV